MKDNKYYTPAEEDFRVGFEYESEETPWGWDKQTVDNLYELEDLCRYQKKDPDVSLRVPYLTKEQIVTEGWVLLDEKSPFTGLPFKFQKSKEFGFNELYTWTLSYHGMNSNPVEIHLKWESSWNRFNGLIYQGRMQSINEFRTIMKLLGI